jgi:gamma-glutamylcyclotransferase (GGCT)/AIG2-like uncharacterized protein YtfP
MNPYLFVYGTLMNTEAEPSASLMKGCSIFCKGKFAGKLYDLGEYPGAVLSSKGEEFVYGDIVFMKTPEITIRLLDDYEGFGDDQEQPNLFVRKLIEVETANGKTACWVYLYNLPVKGFKQIISGKY